MDASLKNCRESSENCVLMGKTEEVFKIFLIFSPSNANVDTGLVHTRYYFP